jgi:hypothetical protein
MSRGGNYDCSIACCERRTDIVTQRFDERITLAIKIHDVLADHFLRMRGYGSGA